MMSSYDQYINLLANGCLAYGQIIVASYSPLTSHLVNDPWSCAFIGYYATLWNKVSVLCQICYEAKLNFSEIGQKTFKKALFSDPQWLSTEISRRSKSS